MTDDEREASRILVRAFQGGAFADLVSDYWHANDVASDDDLVEELLARFDGIVGARIGCLVVHEVSVILAGNLQAPGTLGILAKAEKERKAWK